MSLPPNGFSYSSIILATTEHSASLRRQNHRRRDSVVPEPHIQCGTMQNLWAVSAASLLELLTEARGGPSDAALSRLSQGRTGATGPSWPAVLARLRGIETALLQDVTWWGPLMEERLHRLSDRGDIS